MAVNKCPRERFVYVAIIPWQPVVKPGNKNQKLGTLSDFEFVVDYASTISLDIVFKFHKEW